MSDRLSRGGIAPVEPTDTDPALLAKIAARIEQLELRSRPAGIIWTRSRRASGSGTTAYAREDTYALPFVAQGITVVLPELSEAVVQIANADYPEWQSDELTLIGPVAYQFPVYGTSIRLRGVDGDAKYIMVAAPSGPPIGVSFGVDLQFLTDLLVDAFGPH